MNSHYMEEPVGSFSWLSARKAVIQISSSYGLNSVV